MTLTLRTILLATACVATLAVPAAAQSTGSRVISFGDSLSDTGNLRAVLGNVPPAPVSPPYFAGRFSNGPVFTELLAGGLNSMQLAGVAAVANPDGSQNYAFGGALAQRGGGGAFPPGVPNQIDIFSLARGQTFRAGDLVTLYAGANDLNAALVAPGGNAATFAAAAQAAAGNVSASAASLAALQAPTVVVLTVPDLGTTPRVNTQGALAVSAASSTTSGFNAALASGIAGVASANPGTNFHFVDVQPALREVLADPARFGFSNVTQSCLAVASCVGGSLDVQNSFLFFDALHPTARGHRLFADLVTDHLTAGARAGDAASLSEIGLADRLAGESAIRERARRHLAATNAIPQGADIVEPGFAAPFWGNAYVSLEGAAFDRDASARAAAYDYRAGTLRVGGDYRLSDAFLLGGAVSASQGEVDDARLSYDTQSFSADLYGTAVYGPSFFTLSGGVAHSDFDDFRRQTAVPGIVNRGPSTNAFSANIGLEAGYSFMLGAFSATPTLGVTYARFEVDGFSESGSGARIVYASYDRNVLYGAANLLLGYETTLAGRRAELTGRIGYEDALTDGGDDGVVSTIAGSPARPSFAAFDDLPGRGFILGAGAEVDVGERIGLGANYSVGFGDRIDVSHVGSVSLSYRF